MFLVATDYKVLTTETPINARPDSSAVVTNSQWACCTPSCHSNFQSTQPAAFDVPRIAGESVAGFGLDQTEAGLTLKRLGESLYAAAQ